MEQKTTEATGPQQPRPSCEIPDCESPARYRGTCSPEHHQERALRRQAALRGISLDERSSWHDEDGRVDIDAVRAGTPDLADAPAIYESLCDEVEELRATVARFHERHHPYPSADSPHAYCLNCFTGRKEPGSNFPEYVKWPCPDGEALEGGESR